MAMLQKMEKDMSNYRQYEMGFSHHLIKVKGALPSKFDCQPDRKRRMYDGKTSRSAFIKKQKINLSKECDHEKQFTAEIVDSCVLLDTMVEGTIKLEYEEPLQTQDKETTTNPIITEEKSTQLGLKIKKHYRRSKAVQERLPSPSSTASVPHLQCIKQEVHDTPYVSASMLLQPHRVKEEVHDTSYDFSASLLQQPHLIKEEVDDTSYDVSTSLMQQPHPVKEEEISFYDEFDNASSLQQNTSERLTPTKLHNGVQVLSNCERISDTNSTGTVIKKSLMVMDERTRTCVEVPMEADNSVLYSKLKLHFPEACGMTYLGPCGRRHLVFLCDGKLMAPGGNWNNAIYNCISSMKEPSHWLQRHCVCNAHSEEELNLQYLPLVQRKKKTQNTRKLQCKRKRVGLPGI